MSIELKTASGGSVTLVPEDGVSNVTATVKHESGVLASEGSISAPNSPLVKGAVNASGDAPIYACRAWVNFDGTRDVNGNASTANTARLIRASGNVTSVVRNGAGDYTVNFTTPMLDVNYSAVGSGSRVGASSVIIFELRNPTFNPVTTSSFDFATRFSTNGDMLDTNFVSVAVFR